MIDTSKISYVMKFKYAYDKNTNLVELAKEAVVQIVDRKYDIDVKGKVIYKM